MKVKLKNYLFINLENIIWFDRKEFVITLYFVGKNF